MRPTAVGARPGRAVLVALAPGGRRLRLARAGPRQGQRGATCVDRRTGITLDLGKLLRVLGDLEKHLGATIGRGVHAGVGLLVDVTKTKLVNANPPYLNRRTGTLIRSISASPRVSVSENVIRGTFGSNLDYARYHEEGFTGTITRPAHTRRAHKRRTASGKVHKVAAHSVRQHTARVKYRARHFLRDTVRQRGADAVNKVRDALRFLFKHRRVPGAGELRGGR